MQALPAEDTPRVLDPRFELQLVCASPDIVTPIGAAVDARGRLFVVESHTHDAPKNYARPKSDRIKLFIDKDGDGIPETQSLFAEGLRQAMNLAFAPDGTLFVVCAKEIFALHDRDGDGVSEARTSVLKLDTPNNNPHGQLLALTISHDGWLYTSRGNIGGAAYTFIGSDGHQITGRGEGGEIVRCKTDGTHLERYATGFWNAFDLRFDFKGRLLCVDNDPDSRGPNRLLHIVPGGDYGYKARYGGSGLHPYDAWEGDLPGTLPMIAGVGEAPSAVLNVTHTGFPEDYGASILVTVWGEHNLTLYRPSSAGVSIRATAEKFIEGDELFRPVALAPAPDGSVFITDWMLKNYPNHGQGRIWRLALKSGEKGRQARPQLAKPEPDPAFAAFGRLATAPFEELTQALRSSDPLLQSAAIQSLTRPELREMVIASLDSKDAALRLGALLALQRADLDDPTPLLHKLLGDPDASVRQMALIWAGEKQLKPLLPDLDRAVDGKDISPRLFETWLATVQILQSKGKAERDSKIDPAFIERIAQDESRAPELRALALPRLVEPGKDTNRALLLRLVQQAAHTGLRIEAIRSLATINTPQTLEALTALTLDAKQPARLRCEALLAVSSQPTAALLPLLDDTAPGVALQTVRTLRLAAGDENVRAALEAKLPQAEARLRDAIEFTLGITTERPTTLETWQHLLAEGGDAEAGERVFFSTTIGCVQCHRIHQRGGIIGPDLSVIARVANRQQLIHSIVKPSDEIAPQFQGWMVTTKDHQTILGLQGHMRGQGATIITFDGATRSLPGSNLESLQAMPASLMPEGLPFTMSTGDFRDLLAFLEGLK